jgi:hypothetical protein
MFFEGPYKVAGVINCERARGCIHHPGIAIGEVCVSPIVHCPGYCAIFC